MKLKSEEVAQYLKQHPQFFAEYSDMLSNIYIPHPHSDRAIPISERQTIALRDKNKALQDKFLELVKFGKENDIISEKMHDLAIMFLTFTDLKDFLNESNNQVGKKMNFLLQEMGREVNTIGSKTDLIQVSHIVVDLKNEIEKIREQVQNIL